MMNLRERKLCVVSILSNGSLMVKVILMLMSPLFGAFTDGLSSCYCLATSAEAKKAPEDYVCSQ